MRLSLSSAARTRFTYRVRAKEGEEGLFFVSVLNGPDNWANYAYLGIIRDGEYRQTAKSKVSKDAPSARAFNWFYQLVIAQGAPLGQLEFWHSGKCCRCGRKLTVPSSIESGWGPECAKFMGGG
jgi:hypothetical protein